MKNFLLRAASAFVALSAALVLTTNAFAADDYTMLHSLTTSNDKDNYATITTIGDTIEITGRFIDSPLSSISLTGTGTEDVGYETMINTSEMIFSSVITCEPEEDFGFIDFTFLDEHHARYRIDYDDGWYFRNYPYANELLPCIKKHKVAEDEAALGYVVEDYDEDDYIEAIEKLEQIAFEQTQSCVTDYERAKALFNWVCSNLAYDKDAAKSGFGIEEICIKNVLDNMYTTCAGFANLYCALLGSIDIRGVTISGYAVSNQIPFDELHENGVYHEWTAFWLEDENRWVNADPCWGCANDFSDGRILYGPINSQFFDIDTFALSQFHRAEKAEYRDYIFAGKYFMEAALDKPTPEQPEPIDTPSEQASDGVRSDHANGVRLLPVMIIGSCGIAAVLLIICIFSRKKHK